MEPTKPSPFQPLHPTLKKCKCGFIGTRTQLYRHFDAERFTAAGIPINGFFARHGEVPLHNVDLNNSNTP